MRAAGRALARIGGGAMARFLAEHGTFYEWLHYPQGDAHDPASHVQYYYHAHPGGHHAAAGAEPREHGHFHVFLRPEGIPPGMRPRRPAAAGAGMAHLAAVAVAPDGTPCRLFTTNQWVTGEALYAAEDTIRLLGRCLPAWRRSARATDRWLAALLILFRPRIEVLLRRRDAALAAWAAANPGAAAEDDRRLETPSLAEISVAAERAAVAAALATWSPASGRR